ncbi:MAG: PfkB family carbohydrate kinase [Endozoicomonas sp.]
MINLHNFTPERPVVVIGAAFCDVMLGLDKLPEGGGDVIAEELDNQVGGCAFNVARALQRLSLKPVNAIPVGNGSKGRVVEAAMERENLPVLLRHPTHDNGWCLAMVEAGRERTFITIEGCEQHWSEQLLAQVAVPEHAIIYVSGYELVSQGSEALRNWLLEQGNDKTLFVDFGPRIADIDPVFIQKLLDKHPILTLNRDELKALNVAGIVGDNPQQTAIEIADTCNVSLICRFDKDGATVCLPGCEPVVVPAFKVKVTDTIAAGDSHAAGVIAGLASGLDLAQAVELGNSVAAIVVSRSGSDGAPTLDELRAFQQTALQHSSVNL